MMRQRHERFAGGRWMISAAGVALSIGMLLGSAGCSGKSDSASGEKSSTTTLSASSASPKPASNTAWNPCSIPDSDIAAAGLNPARRVGDTSKYGTKFPGWDICGWMSDSWYGLNLYSTNSHTFDEVIHNTTNFADPRTVSVGGRSAVMLDPLYVPQGCTLVFNASSGPVQFELGPKASADQAGDACVEVTRIAAALVKDLPAQ
ncbi:DUF3558 domain-containing protein [Nocardia nova]|uniref:DUF3558 domain-containing protein n=2 Tax=Nocardiaceae TaxID=85025 RepID=A0A2T2Z3W3_9NOCA|nr:DUF3558 domain-containing protein [Nocardia nova]